MFKLDKKVVIVTGSGSGIGRAVSLLFAKQGAKVCILDLDGQEGRSVATEIHLHNGVGSFYKCNIAKHGDVQQVIDIIIAEDATIDILVNNAGIAHIGTAETTTEEDLERLLNVNVQGVFNCLHAVLPVRKVKGGVILNLASVAASVGLSERFAYSTSKAAIVRMTLTVAKNYLAYNVRCNCVLPGRVHTPFVDGYLQKTYPGKEQEMFEKLSKTQPFGRIGKPEEIAVYDYDKIKGHISNKREMIHIDEKDGCHDGMTIDNEGRLGIAR
jgi:2-keto-3-deoxy-L-fuconate dehydrogenase